MSPQANDTHVDLYNKLPLIHDAYATLREELKADLSVSNDDLMLPILKDLEVHALFRDGIPGENVKPKFFGIWIVHRHHALESGERMVATGNVSTPTPKDSAQFAERWDPNGNAIEFVHAGEDNRPIHRAPSRSFAKAFQELMSRKFGVSSLGLCLDTCGRLQPGFVFFETTDDKTRSQIVDIVPRHTITAPSANAKYGSAWSILDWEIGAQVVCLQCVLREEISGDALGVRRFDNGSK